jgi:hypothetical protein
MPTHKHEPKFAGRARHTLRAVREMLQDGAHGVPRLSFSSPGDSYSLASIRGLKISENYQTNNIKKI